VSSPFRRSVDKNIRTAQCSTIANPPSCLPQQFSYGLHRERLLNNTIAFELAPSDDYSVKEDTSTDTHRTS